MELSAVDIAAELRRTLERKLLNTGSSDSNSDCDGDLTPQSHSSPTSTPRILESLPDDIPFPTIVSRSLPIHPETQKPVFTPVCRGHVDTLGFGSKKNRYEFAERYGREHGPAIGGTNDLPLYSYEIDNVLRMANDLNSLPAEFVPILRNEPDRAKAMFLAMNYPMVLPIHCEFHWTAAHITQGIIELADSDPHPIHLAHLEFLCAAFSLWTGTPFTFVQVAVPHQPPRSAQCGVHTTINCLAFGWSCLNGAEIICRDKRTQAFLRFQATAGEPFHLPDAEIIAVVSNEFYLSLPTRLSLKFSITNPMSPQARAIGAGSLSTITLTHDEVKDSLRSAKVGDTVHFTWSDAETPPTVWKGVLKKPFRGRWSVEVELPDNKLTDTMLPDGDFVYHNVTITPQVVAIPVVQTATPPARKPHKPANPLPPHPVSLSTETATAERPEQQPGTDSPPELPATPPVEIIDPAQQSPEIASLYRAYIETKNGSTPGNLQRLSGETTTASQLLTYLVQPEIRDIAPSYRHHLAPSTIKQQQRTLRWLLKHLPPSEECLDVAIPQAVGRMAAARCWAPTTWHTRLLNIQGALVALFIYRAVQTSIALARCPRWNSSLRTVVHLKPLYHPAQPLALSKDQIEQAIALEPLPMVKAALELAWLSAARGGDIRQILAKDIHVTNSTQHQMGSIAMTIRRGKTAKKEQYTVGIPLPSPPTLDFLNERKRDGSWAFPGLTGDQLRAALRRVHPKLEQRSLRRGRLQHLSRHENWSDLQLLELSRHASVAMLRRYLDMGVVSATTRETALRAGPTTASSPASQ